MAHTYLYAWLDEALNAITESHTTPEMLQIAHATAAAYQKPARSQYSVSAIRAAYTTAYPRAARPMPITQALEAMEANRATAYRPSGLFVAMCNAQEWRQSIREVAEPQSIQARLKDHSDRKFWQAFKQAGYRISTNTYERTVERGPNARASTGDWQDWEGYAKKYGHPMHCFGYYFTIPSDWGARVRLQGLAIVDGLLTLDAVRLDTRLAQGQALYAATWVKQERGVTLSSESGYIAYDHQAHVGYHAFTAQQAAKGLARKVGAARFEQWANRQDLGPMVAKALAFNPAIEVTLHDAKRVGSCTPGIQSWCHQTGLSVELSAGKAPLAKVFAAYQRVPAVEARAAILEAIRKDAAVRRALCTEEVAG